MVALPPIRASVRVSLPDFRLRCLADAHELVVIVSDAGNSGTIWDACRLYLHRAIIHPKLNGTESQRTPDQVSCDPAIRHSGFRGP